MGRVILPPDQVNCFNWIFGGEWSEISFPRALAYSKFHSAPLFLNGLNLIHWRILESILEVHLLKTVKPSVADTYSVSVNSTLTDFLGLRKFALSYFICQEFVFQNWRIALAKLFSPIGPIRSDPYPHQTVTLQRCRSSFSLGFGFCWIRRNRRS